MKGYVLWSKCFPPPLGIKHRITRSAGSETAPEGKHSLSAILLNFVEGLTLYTHRRDLTDFITLNI